MSQESSSSLEGELVDPRVARLYAFDELLPSPQPAQVEVIEWFPSLDLFSPGAGVNMPTDRLVYVQNLTLQHVLEHAAMTNRTTAEYRVQTIGSWSEEARITLRRVGDDVPAELVTNSFMPIFSKAQGWVSVCPEETYRTLAFSCELLTIGDVLVISDV
jgi:hypothetical protein